MLPLEPWLAAMNIESNLPGRPPRAAADNGTHLGLRRTVGRGLIALGLALAGNEPVNRPLSAGR